MTTVDVPTAVHIGADELPFVDIGDGSKLKVIQVKKAEGLWIVENVFQANYVVQRHKDTGRFTPTQRQGRGSTRSTTT